MPNYISTQVREDVVTISMIVDEPEKGVKSVLWIDYPPDKLATLIDLLQAAQSALKAKLAAPTA